MGLQADWGLLVGNVLLMDRVGPVGLGYALLVSARLGPIILAQSDADPMVGVARAQFPYPPIA